jgi:hypothetical protein
MIREQEARERLDSQINAITPIIDSISWHDIMATDDEIAISEE